jgi:hypothetical protein
MKQRIIAILIVGLAFASCNKTKTEPEQFQCFSNNMNCIVDTFYNIQDTASASPIEASCHSFDGINLENIVFNKSNYVLKDSIIKINMNAVAANSNFTNNMMFVVARNENNFEVKALAHYNTCVTPASTSLHNFSTELNLPLLIPPGNYNFKFINVYGASTTMSITIQP